MLWAYKLPLRLGSLFKRGSGEQEPSVVLRPLFILATAHGGPGLVGSQKERFRSITLSGADLAFLTIEGLTQTLQDLARS